MRVCSPTPFLVLCLLIQPAYGQGESTDALYKCVLNALKTKDCALAKNCWEKYKGEFAEEFKKNPKVGKEVDDAISKCESPPSRDQKEGEITKRDVAAGGAANGAVTSEGRAGAGAAAGTVAIIAVGVLGVAAATSSSNH